MFESISDNNPHLEEMRERGWAWVETNGHGKYGAPHTDNAQAEKYVRRNHPEDDPEDDETEAPTGFYNHDVRIVSWE